MCGIVGFYPKSVKKSIKKSLKKLKHTGQQYITFFGGGKIIANPAGERCTR
jgi:hypothetical protein